MGPLAARYADGLAWWNIETSIVVLGAIRGGTMKSSTISGSSRRVGPWRHE
jgi:hypothetical protein